MKNTPNVNFDIKASKGETCPYCDKSLSLGMNHPLVEVDGKVSHLRCAFIYNLTHGYVCPECGDKDCF